MWIKNVRTYTIIVYIIVYPSVVRIRLPAFEIKSETLDTKNWNRLTLVAVVGHVVNTSNVRGVYRQYLLFLMVGRPAVNISFA